MYFKAKFPFISEVIPTPKIFPKNAWDVERKPILVIKIIFQYIKKNYCYSTLYWWQQFLMQLLLIVGSWLVEDWRQKITTKRLKGILFIGCGSGCFHETDREYKPMPQPLGRSRITYSILIWRPIYRQPVCVGIYLPLAPAHSNYRLETPKHILKFTSI
jgi:hypothetical protein